MTVKICFDVQIDLSVEGAEEREGGGEELGEEGGGEGRRGRGGSRRKQQHQQQLESTNLLVKLPGFVHYQRFLYHARRFIMHVDKQQCQVLDVHNDLPVYHAAVFASFSFDVQR